MPQRTAKKAKRRPTTRKKGSSYKKLPIVKKTNDLLRRLFSVIFLLVLACTGAVSFYLYHSFRNPFAQAAGSLPRELRWDGKTPINLALIQISDFADDDSLLKKVFILHIDPEGERYSLKEVGTAQTISMPFGFGQNSLEKAYAIGNSAEPKLNTALTCRLLESSEKVPVEGYFLTDISGWEAISSSIGEVDPSDLGKYVGVNLLFRAKSLYGAISNGVRTDLSLPEIYNIITSLSRAKSSMSRFCEIKKDCSSDFMDTTVISADKKIVVLNGTNKSGLATFCAQLIKSIGGRVVFVSNTKEEYSKTTLLTDSFEDYTSLRLQQVFGITEAFHKDAFFDKEDFIDRGDIILIVGLDKMGFWW